MNDVEVLHKHFLRLEKELEALRADYVPNVGPVEFEYIEIAFQRGMEIGSRATALSYKDAMLNIVKENKRSTLYQRITKRISKMMRL